MANLAPVDAMACNAVLSNGQNAYIKSSSSSTFWYKLKNHTLFIPLAF